MLENNRYFLNSNDIVVMIELQDKQLEYNFKTMLSNLSVLKSFDIKMEINGKIEEIVLDSLKHLDAQGLITGFAIQRVRRRSIIYVGKLSEKGKVIVDSFRTISDESV